LPQVRVEISTFGWIRLLFSAGLYPLELVKTRMQVVGGENVVYRSFSKSITSIWRTEGFRGFFQGLSPAVFAASGSWGGYFYFYESSKERKVNSYQRELGPSDHVRFFQSRVCCVIYYC
jgi:solute carrier family 25 folate transporter 32